MSLYDHLKLNFLCVHISWSLLFRCMATGFVLNSVFDRLNSALKTIESIEGIAFATSTKYGYVTSCPSNLGTGMRASVHLKIPNLTAGGTEERAKAAAKPLGLSVRGTGGEHTPIGADGTVDISPSNRLFITEAEIVTKLYNGIKLLLEKEAAAERSETASALEVAEASMASLVALLLQQCSSEDLRSEISRRGLA